MAVAKTPGNALPVRATVAVALIALIALPAIIMIESPLQKIHPPLMLLLPIHTPILKPGDALADILMKSAKILSGDIVVISSKAIATIEGAMIDLRTLKPSPDAVDLSNKIERTPSFCEGLIKELIRLNGTIISTCPGAALTELRPQGLASGSILIANAGLDESNVKKGCAIGWPGDPVLSVRRLREQLRAETAKRVERAERKYLNSASSLPSSPSQPFLPSLAIILTDSSCTPRRTGVTAIALTVSGLDPLQSMKGEHDLFRKPLRITTEAVADQLATAANFLMGNAGQSVPAVIIRDHGLTLSDWEGWVPGIEADQDLFRGVV